VASRASPVARPTPPSHAEERREMTVEQPKREEHHHHYHGAPPRSRLPGLLSLLGVVVAIPALALAGLWWRADAAERARQELEAELKRQRETFELEMARILGESRRAQFEVVEQRKDDNGAVVNKIRFMEFLDSDEPTSFTLVREFELPGREVYIDAVLVQYDNDAVRLGKARNFAVFRRAFTNMVSPDDGVPLYDVTLRQTRSRALQKVEMTQKSDADAFVERLVSYMANPALARADKVRLIEGEAKYVAPRPGFAYTIVQRANGGLMIEETELPPSAVEGEKLTPPIDPATRMGIGK
jgi:hypothetical protein